MNTKHIKVDKSVDKSCTYPQVQKAADFLKQGEVVAFPTETVYGLGGNVYSDQAIAKIFSAKGRPSDNPLIVHIGHLDQLRGLVTEVNETAERLIEEFWPGPLTIIFNKKSDQISNLVTADLDTLAVRMPDNELALNLLQTLNIPLAAPSANKSGKPSPTKAEHVLKDLSGKIAAVLDGGPTGLGLESTVVDCTSYPPIVLRPGGITVEELEALLGEVKVDQALLEEDTSPRSPGMKYRHYSPSAPLILVKGSREFLQSLVREGQLANKKVGVLASDETYTDYEADLVLKCGSRHDLKTVAAQLFTRLREFDQAEVDLIFSEVFPEEGLGVAIMNRLKKAAKDDIVHEIKK